jgi:hypothetical protein
MTSPPRRAYTNRADPSSPPLQDLLWYKAALTEWSVDIEWKPNWVFSGFSFSMAFEDQWTAIFHLRTVSLSEVDRQSVN